MIGPAEQPEHHGGGQIEGISIADLAAQETAEDEPAAGWGPQGQPAASLSAYLTEAIKMTEGVEPDPDRLVAAKNELFHQADQIAAHYRRLSAAHSRQIDILRSWADWLPERIVSEDLGDYLERIDNMLRRDRRLSAWICAIGAIASTAFNGLVYVVLRLVRNRRST
jgi:hypothetical protein